MNRLQEQPKVTSANSFEARSVQIAAEAVVAQVTGRAPGRIQRVSLWPEISLDYTLPVCSSSLQTNRGLLEDLTMTALAPKVIARICGAQQEWSPIRSPAELLSVGLTAPAERAVQDAYLTVLEARAEALLARYWSAVQIVAYTLSERGTLSGEEIGHHIFCAQSMRARLLN